MFKCKEIHKKQNGIHLGEKKKKTKQVISVHSEEKKGIQGLE